MSPRFNLFQNVICEALRRRNIRDEWWANAEGGTLTVASRK